MKEEEKLWKDELDALLGKLVDDGLTVADKARLNEILQTEPGAREFYHEYLDHSWSLGGKSGCPGLLPTQRRNRSRNQGRIQTSLHSFRRMGMGGSGRGGDWVVHPIFRGAKGNRARVTYCSNYEIKRSSALDG